MACMTSLENVKSAFYKCSLAFDFANSLRQSLNLAQRQVLVMICQQQTIKCCSIKYTFTFSWNCIDPIDPIDPTDPTDPTDPHQIQDWLCPLCPLCLAQEGCPGRTDSATAKSVLCLRYHHWSCSVLASVTVNSNANVFSLNGHNAMTFHSRGKLKLPSYNQVLPHARQATETFISATHWHTLAK